PSRGSGSGGPGTEGREDRRMKALSCAESAGSLVPAGEGDAVGDHGDGLGGGLTLDGLSSRGEAAARWGRAS
ncbi:hypothetical protein ACFQHS_43720, partial [Nonomuraea dietziae]|uniref:hypothetical protein n=1 Tax=Nonomuraea dietziae TaxID=65515 RepID=UPI0036154B18